MPCKHQICGGLYYKPRLEVRYENGDPVKRRLRSKFEAAEAKQATGRRSICSRKENAVLECHSGFRSGMIQKCSVVDDTRTLLQRSSTWTLVICCPGITIKPKKRLDVAPSVESSPAPVDDVGSEGERRCS